MDKKVNITTFEEHLDERYGKIGTRKRDEFELRAKAFMIGEMIKEARKEAKMTQEQLAWRTGTKKSYISRIENGKVDVQLSTLFKIFEEGLGKKLSLNVS
jgi:DNA-binding XRE family transcriptional regulator